MNNLKFLHFAILLSVAAGGLASCRLMPDHGMYVGSKYPGWDRSRTIAEGASQTYLYFPPKAAHQPTIEIYFATPEKGKLAIGFTGPHGDSDPVIASEKLLVRCHDTKASGDLDIAKDMLLDVGSSNDFTVTVPSFNVGGVQAPKLEVHFHWDPSTVYYAQPLM